MWNVDCHLIQQTLYLCSDDCFCTLVTAAHWSLLQAMSSLRFKSVSMEPTPARQERQCCGRPLIH